jgi:hypothetical protein
MAAILWGSFFILLGFGCIIQRHKTIRKSWEYFFVKRFTENGEIKEEYRTEYSLMVVFYILLGTAFIIIGVLTLLGVIEFGPGGSESIDDTHWI